MDKCSSISRAVKIEKCDTSEEVSQSVQKTDALPVMVSALPLICSRRAMCCCDSVTHHMTGSVSVTQVGSGTAACV